LTTFNNTQLSSRSWFKKKKGVEKKREGKRHQSVIQTKVTLVASRRKTSYTNKRRQTKSQIGKKRESKLTRNKGGTMYHGSGS